MKTLKTTFAFLVLLITVTSCSKKEDEIVQSSTPKTLIFSNNNVVDIPVPPQALVASGLSEIIVPNTGIIGNKDKITVEVNVEFPDKKRVAMTLVAPDGTQKYFVYRVGVVAGGYKATNKLRFNSLFTAGIPGNTVDVPAGDYKSTVGSNYDPLYIESPIFSFLQGKQIQGKWTLRVSNFDSGVGVTGYIASWKIIFDEGAIQ